MVCCDLFFDRNASWPLAESCTKHNLKPVTLSIGVAQASPEDGPDALIRQADQAMYQAKRTGGDRIVIAGDY